jgi:hypothetical protein
MKPLILTEVDALSVIKTTPLSSPVSPSRVHLSVRVQPGAARTAVQGMLGDAVKIRVAAQPEDGAANAALCKWLQKATAAQAVQVISGASGRSKLLALDFADAAPSLAQLQQALLQQAPSHKK